MLRLRGPRDGGAVGELCRRLSSFSGPVGPGFGTGAYVERFIDGIRFISDPSCDDPRLAASCFFSATRDIVS